MTIVIRGLGDNLIITQGYGLKQETPYPLFIELEKETEYNIELEKETEYNIALSNAGGGTV